MATIESEIATSQQIKKTHIAQALKGDDYPGVTETFYTFSAGKLTQVDINYTDTDFPDEILTFEYWNSGSSNITINGHTYSQGANCNGNLRQVVRTITGGDTITTSYGYDANGILERFGRGVA